MSPGPSKPAKKKNDFTDDKKKESQTARSALIREGRAAVLPVGETACTRPRPRSPCCRPACVRAGTGTGSCPPCSGRSAPACRRASPARTRPRLRAREQAVRVHTAWEVGHPSAALPTAWQVGYPIRQRARWVACSTGAPRVALRNLPTQRSPSGVGTKPGRHWMRYAHRNEPGVLMHCLARPQGLPMAHSSMSARTR